MNRLLIAILVAPILIGCETHSSHSTDIWTAAATGDSAIIQEYIASGGDLNVQEPASGSSPLIVAVVFGQTEAAKLLVERGAALDVTNNDGSTALHVAAFFCLPEMVSFLLEQGANPESKNQYGQTPLETVTGEWTGDLEGVYSMVAKMWNLDLNQDRIRETRPQVAALIRQHTNP